jgi:hypothetical protein
MMLYRLNKFYNWFYKKIVYSLILKLIIEGGFEFYLTALINIKNVNYFN